MEAFSLLLSRYSRDEQADQNENREIVGFIIVQVVEHSFVASHHVFRQLVTLLVQQKIVRPSERGDLKSADL